MLNASNLSQKRFRMQIAFKPSNAMHKNLWLLVISFYIIPLLISFEMILSRGQLLGDFAFAPVVSSISELYLVGFLYLLPGIIFILIAKACNRISSKFKMPNSIKFSSASNVKKINIIFSLLVLSTIGAALFGLPTISGGGDGGEVNLVQKLILYLNPSIMFMVIAISNPSPKKLLISAICLVYVGFVQLSLLPLFLTVIGISTWWFCRYPVSLLRFVAILLTLMFLIFLGKEYVHYLYGIRNSARGASELFEIDQLFVYAIGRINSFSSLYYLWNDRCCQIQASDFYLINSVIERFVGFELPSYSSSEAFNDTYLEAGYDKYSIFASYAGQFVIDYNSSIFRFFVSVFSAIFLLAFSYILVPYPARSEKIPIFFLFIFSVYLSGDAWEFSVFLRSLILINIILFIISKLRFFMNFRLFL